jgi:lipopolysaccharide export system protein LptC
MKLLPALSGAERGAVRARQPWVWRLQQWLANWLPLGLMALLAVFTAWLVRTTPGAPLAERAQRLTPDYQMRRFELQRFGIDGQTQAWLRGDALRHYPIDDRIEFDAIRLELQGSDGSWLHAESERAVGPQDGSQLRMSGQVRVRRWAPGADPASARPELELQTTELLAERNGERLSSRAPTLALTPNARIELRGFRYTHGNGLLQFDGPSRTVLNPR